MSDRAARIADRAKEMGLSAARLGRLAGISESSVRRVFRRQSSVSDEVLSAIELALIAVRRGTDEPSPINALWRLSLYLMAADLGIPLAAIDTDDASPKRKATNNPEWMQAAKVRRRAVYLLNTVFGYPTTTVLESLQLAQAAAAAADADRQAAQQAATDAEEHAAAAALWDPASYSTTDEIDSKLDDYALAEREISGTGCVKVNGGASADLSADVTIAIQFASSEQAIAGEGAGLPIDSPTLAATLAATVAGVPTGAVLAFDLDAPPPGWIVGDGSAVNRLIYADLDAAMYCGDANNGTATAWYRCTNPASPSASRSTTGNYLVTRDVRGVFTRFLDGGRGLDSGRVRGSYQADAFAAHSITVPTSTPAGSGPFGVLSNTGAGPGSFSISVSGGSETRPKNWAGLGCIKY